MLLFVMIGMHCSEFNLTEPVGDCDAGYYCPSAADSPTFLLCTEGHYCESGSAQPTPCPQGKDKCSDCGLCTCSFLECDVATL